MEQSKFEKEQKILQLVSKQILDNPEFAGKIIDCITYSLRKVEEQQREAIARKDKALTVLFAKSNFGNDKNLEDTALEMTNNVFNGSGKKYTLKDIKKAIKK